MEVGNTRLHGNDNLLPNNTKYRQAISTLLYISRLTRPDISTAVNILSRRNETTREKYWKSVKRVITYLDIAKKPKLNFKLKKNKPILEIYAGDD